MLVGVGAVKAVQAANSLAEGEHQDGIYRLANSGVPSINGQMVRRIEHVGWGINRKSWDEARDWMLKDKANRIVETVQGVYPTQVLWERIDKTKPMQLAPKGLGINWLNFYPEAKLLETKMTSDITDNQSTTEMVSHITGIPSKGQYEKDIMEEVPTGRRVCVYGIDMAYLKVLNGSKSHDTADAVLKRYADELTDLVKSAESSELVERAFAYHMHDDEFCVLLVAAEGAGATAFAACARDTLLRRIADIKYDYEAEGYPESYLRVGALCSVDATYEKADGLQELVGKKLKLAYPDRSQVHARNQR